MAEEMLCVPKLYASISTCMLRVVNNDTAEEIPRVFQKVAPYVYKKNKVPVHNATFSVPNKTTKCSRNLKKLRTLVFMLVEAFSQKWKQKLKDLFL